MRLGIFGGTFDPIHTAHLAVAKTAIERFALDRLLLVPAAQPPHKQGPHATFDHRLAMVRLAIAGNPQMAASDLERGTGRSYSILTVERVRADLEQDDELFFVIGADAFEEIETWYRWRELLRKVDFIVVTRPGYTYDVPDGATAYELGGLSMEVSSSELRDKLNRGEKPEQVPDAVYRYIVEKGLYR